MDKTSSESQSPEAQLITTDLLQDLLTAANQQDLTVDEYTIAPGTKPGENLFNAVFRVHITTHQTNRGESQEHTQLIVKTKCLSDENRDQFTAMFNKEIKTYEEIVPAMMNITQKTETPMELPMPKLCGARLDSRQAILAVEDLGMKGYETPDDTDGLDLNHCELVMKELAKFHAFSYALERTCGDIKQMYPFVYHETFVNDYAEKEMSQFFRARIQAVVGHVRGSVVEEHLVRRAEKLLDMNIFQEFRNAYNVEGPFSVICHGDFWEKNMLFKYDERKVPVAVKFIDFQLIRHSAPTTDLCLFLASATAPPFRRAHLDDLLKLYHQSFHSCLNKLAITFHEYTLDKIRELYYRHNIIGFLNGIVFLPVTKAERSDGHTTDNEEFILEMGNNRRCQYLTETVLEAIEQGIL